MAPEFDRLIEEERFEEATRVLEPLVDSSTGRYERFRLGVCYFRLGKFRDAHAVLLPLLDDKGEYSREAQMVSGYALKGLKRWKEAARAFESVLSLSEVSSEEKRMVQVLAAACREEEGDFAGALAIYKSIGLSGTDEDDEILLRRSAVHEKLSEWTEAERLYDEFIRRFADHAEHPRALFKHAQCLYEQGRFLRAAEEFEALAKLEPASFLTEMAGEFAAKAREGQQGSMKAAKHYGTYH